MAGSRLTTPPAVASIIAAVLLLFSACFSSSRASHGSETKSASEEQIPDEKIINKIVLPLVKKTNGALVIAFTDGHRHQILGYGCLDDETEIKANKDTIFEIGSLTKVFTGILLASLHRDNKLSFDDPVGKYLPKGTIVPDYQGKQLTLFQLATHTSGLPRDPDNFFPGRALYGREQFHAFLARCPLKSAPGTAYFYSNAGFTLLGEALENAGKDTYWHLLNNRLLTPLKLKDTQLVLTRQTTRRLAHGHDKFGQAIDCSPLSGGPAGGLKSSAPDLLLLLDTALQKKEGRITGDISQSCRRRFRLNRSEYACLGWFYNSTNDSYYKSGQINGYSACMQFSPRKQTGMVVLSATLQLEAEPIMQMCQAAYTESSLKQKSILKRG